MSRTKISTTVSSETYHFLEEMVSSGQATTMAEALDSVITKLKQFENRKRLAQATTRYFEQLDSRSAAEEYELSESMASSASGIDFDKEI